MRLRKAAPLILISTLAAAIIAVACAQDTTSVIQTTTAQQKEDNRQATRAALTAAGIDPDVGAEAAVGKGSIAEQVQQTAFANSTATAEAGGGQEDLVRLPDGSLVEPARATAIAEGGTPEEPIDPLDGEALSGEITIKLGNAGRMDPAVIKVKVGTTITWANQERSAHATRSDPGQAEQWDSGDLSRKVTDKENKSFSHTFTIPGRYTYGSNISGDPGRGTVFVVE
jgi:plastocyanin